MEKRIGEKVKFFSTFLDLICDKFLNKIINLVDYPSIRIGLIFCTYSQTLEIIEITL